MFHCLQNINYYYFIYLLIYLKVLYLNMKCNIQTLKVNSFITFLFLLIIIPKCFNTIKNIIIINLYKYGLFIFIIEIVFYFYEIQTE